MRVEDACALLARHNEWRRGGDAEMGSPKLLGLAIETVIAAASEADRLRMRVSELEGITAFDAALQELDARGRRIDDLNAALVKANSQTEHFEREWYLRGDEIECLTSAIQQTLNDNGHLADGDNCTLIVLKRALGIQQCKKCGADMQPGVAMGQTLTGMPDFIGGECCTVSPGGPGKLIECSKCPECGYSTT